MQRTCTLIERLLLLPLPLLLLPLFLTCSACSLGTEHLEVPLFFEYDPVIETGELWTTFPLFLSGKKEKVREDEERHYLLYPLFSAVREGREREYSFLTMNVYRERFDHRGFKKTDVFLGPVWWGSSAQKGSYLMVLPFGGTMKGIFGKDYGIAVTPFFWYLEDETSVGLFRSYHMPFPIVNWVSGGGRSGFRIFPLYAHYQRHDAEGNLAYDRTWIMWPLWQSLRNNINTVSGEQWMWFLFPFYGRGGGPNHRQWTILWPLFHYFEKYQRENVFPFYRTFTDYWEIKAPFPLFIYGKGLHRWRLDFWPIFGWKERDLPLLTGGHDRYRRYFVLGPLHRWEQTTTEDYKDTKWWLMPFVWSFEREYTTGTSAYQLKLWPLFRYKRDRDGSTSVNVLSPLWFWDPEGAFEQIYNPLTRIYERRRRGEVEDTRILWGLYSHSESPERADLTIHPFLFWDEEAKDGSERDVAFLFGLFRYIRRGGRKALRFFWLPEWPSWGEDEAPPQDPYDAEESP